MGSDELFHRHIPEMWCQCLSGMPGRHLQSPTAHNACLQGRNLTPKSDKNADMALHLRDIPRVVADEVRAAGIPLGLPLLTVVELAGGAAKIKARDKPQVNYDTQQRVHTSPGRSSRLRAPHRSPCSPYTSHASSSSPYPLIPFALLLFTCPGIALLFLHAFAFALS